MARPKTHDDTSVRLEAMYPADQAAALEVLAEVSGEAKASHLRRALSWYLAELAMSATKTTEVVTQPKENTP